MATTEEELKEIISASGIKTSVEDPIPSDILQSVIDVALPSKFNQQIIQKKFNGRCETICY